jgi:hypothetical protein
LRIPDVEALLKAAPRYWRAATWHTAAATSGRSASSSLYPIRHNPPPPPPSSSSSSSSSSAAAAAHHLHAAASLGIALCVYRCKGPHIRFSLQHFSIPTKQFPSLSFITKMLFTFSSICNPSARPLLRNCTRKVTFFHQCGCGHRPHPSFGRVISHKLLCVWQYGPLGVLRLLGFLLTFCSSGGV